MRIRAADLADAQGIAEVHVASWQWAYRGQLPDSHLDALSVSARTASWRLQLCQPEMDTFVAEDNDRIVGFASAGPVRDAVEHLGEIYAIYRVPAAGGKGVGRRLMERCSQALIHRGYETAVLWVLVSNVNARGFYERLGWYPDGAVQSLQRDDLTLNEVRYRTTLRG